MKYYLFSALAFLLITSLTSCEKVITLNVSNSKPVVVIEGAIDDGPGPYSVTVRKSINYEDKNSFPSVGTAMVVVKGSSGQQDTFGFVGNGRYESKTLVGRIGETYTIQVFLDGQSYTASSKMPQLVPFKELIIEQDKDFFGDSVQYALIRFDDPIGVPNYYSFEEYRDGKEQSRAVESDRFKDGKLTEVDFQSFDPADSLSSGTTVRILMRCIDKGTYDYLETLQDVGYGGGQSIAPANPITQFTNGALGYFSAQTEESKSIVVP